MPVETSLAAYLKSPSLIASFVNAAVGAGWGEDAVRLKSQSPLADRAEALEEAERIADLRASPLAVDAARVVGIHTGLVGKTVSLDGGGVIVVGEDPDYGAGTTLLTVLRRLG